MWRSGSTFVWSRFRQAPQTYCYFEPLYKGLSRLTRERIFKGDWREAIADNRHPAMAAPYYLEYAPLVRGRGVAGFRRDFSLGRYALTPDQPDRALDRYLGSLIAQASEQGRTPVLGCNRTGLRMGWIKRRFGSVDVHVEREPDLIWASYMEHAQKGNYSYFTNLLTILENNRDHPLFAPLARKLPLRSGVAKLFKPKYVYETVAREMANEISYALVLYFWTLNLLHALTHCDVVLDASLSRREDYRRRISYDIGHACGIPVNFDGFRRMKAATDVSMRDRLAAERLVLDLAPYDDIRFFDLETVERRLSEIAPASAAFIDRLLAKTAHKKAA